MLHEVDQEKVKEGGEKTTGKGAAFGIIKREQGSRSKRLVTDGYEMEYWDLRTTLVKFLRELLYILSEEDKESDY
jgi:hypothetical protein